MAHHFLCKSHTNHPEKKKNLKNEQFEPLLLRSAESEGTILHEVYMQAQQSCIYSFVLF